MMMFVSDAFLPLTPLLLRKNEATASVVSHKPITEMRAATPESESHFFDQAQPKQANRQDGAERPTTGRSQFAVVSRDDQLVEVLLHGAAQRNTKDERAEERTRSRAEQARPGTEPSTVGRKESVVNWKEIS
jgi:hypothetical protein